MRILSQIVLLGVWVLFGVTSSASAQDFQEVFEEPQPVYSGTPFAAMDFFGLDTPYTSQMLDFQNRQSDKELTLLNRAAMSAPGNAVTVGASFRASGLVGRTNRQNKFSYLGRFPTDFEGDSATDFRLLQANQNVTINVGQQYHGYIETLFSDVFTFPSFNQGSFQVRQAYLVFGDFNRSPLYFHIGKKNVTFGDMRSLSPFTQSMPWHYFAPLAEGAGVGYDDGAVNLSVTALNGSRGIRVVDSERKGHLNNFAANVLMRFTYGQDVKWNLGGGYLHGTIYNNAVAEHINPDLFGPDNAAWDVNTYLQMGAYEFFAEYVTSSHPWPATDHRVSAYSIEAARNVCWAGRPGRASFSWSEGIQGPPGSEFQFNKQLVLGYQYQAHPNASFTFEYVRSIGFAPLINIQTVSDADVRQNSFVFGAVLSL